MKTVQLFLFHNWELQEIVIVIALLAFILTLDWFFLKASTHWKKRVFATSLLWVIGWIFFGLSLFLGTWMISTPVADFAELKKALVIGVTSPSSFAAEVGLENGDRILQVNDVVVDDWSEVEDAFLHRGYFELDLLIQRGAEKVTHKMHLVLSGNDTFSGIAPSEVFLEEVFTGSEADQAGLMPGDQLLSIQGLPIKTWEDVRSLVHKNEWAEVPIEIRSQGQIQKLKLRLRGIRSALRLQRPSLELVREKNILQALAQATTQALQWSAFPFQNLTDISGVLFSGALGKKNKWFGEHSPRVYKGVQHLSFYLTLLGGLLCALAPLLLLLELVFVKKNKTTLLRVCMWGASFAAVTLAFLFEIALLDRYFIL